MKYPISLLLLALLTTVSAQIQFEHEEWARVKNQAHKEGKIVFVDAYTTWCGPCKWMSKNVFTDPEVAEFYNANFINLKLDMEKGEGLTFASEYGVNAYPSLLFVDGEGTLLHKHLGAVPADQFITVGSEALSPDKRIGTFAKKYEAHKNDKAFVQEYLLKMLGAGIPVTNEADAYFEMLEPNEVVTEENLLIIRMLRPQVDSKAFEVLLENRAGFSKLSGAEPVDGLIESVLAADVFRAIRTKDVDTYRDVRAKIASMDLEEKGKILTMADMEFSDAQGDMTNYLKHASSYAKDYVWNDPSALNNLAWDMYLNSSLDNNQMKLARKIAKRAVKLDENYYNTDTYAAVLYKSGKYKPAQQWANTAIAAAKAAGENPEETMILLEKIEAAMK